MLPSVEPSAAGPQYSRKTLLLTPIYVVSFVFARLSSLQWRRILRPAVVFGWEDVNRRKTDTSWLDGLRGVAAVQVFFYHFFGRYTDWAHPWGSREEDKYIHQLPIFRSLYFGGPGAVSVFFVISGYAITVKSFSLLRQRRHDELYKGLCSSLFRRGFRLWIPVFAVAIPALILSRYTNLVAAGYMYGNEVKDTWWQQIGHYIADCSNHFNPFTYKDNGDKGPMNRYAYIPQAWTIPMEFYGSFVSYLMVMMVSQVGVYKTRFIIMAATSAYAVHRGCWWASNFLVGMLLADSVLEQKSRIASGMGAAASSRRWTAFWFFVFFAGWYFQGMCPKIMAFDFAPVDRYGYEFLYKLYLPHSVIQIKEEVRWYWYLSGNLTVVGISQVSWLRAFFDTKFCQWLGKLSFSLYLIHLLVVQVSLNNLERFCRTFISSNNAIMCLFVWSVCTMMILFCSTLIERWIDRPAIRFARWIEAKAFAHDEYLEKHPDETVHLVRAD